MSESPGRYHSIQAMWLSDTQSRHGRKDTKLRFSRDLQVCRRPQKGTVLSMSMAPSRKRFADACYALVNRTSSECQTDLIDHCTRFSFTPSVSLKRAHRFTCLDIQAQGKSISPAKRKTPTIDSNPRTKYSAFDHQNHPAYQDHC